MAQTPTTSAGPQDFICALATAAGENARSAVAVIRASGKPRADGTTLFSIINPHFRTRGGLSLEQLKPRLAYYGELFADGETLDDVLFIKFVGNASFTGEDSFEIHCHGNPILTRRVLALLFALKIRPAEAGEFTRRAFLNGKLNLDAAQAIQEIVDARSAETLRAARRLREGHFRNQMLAVRSALMNVLADLNAELDFIDEDISFSSREAKLASLDKILADLVNLAGNATRFDAMKAGVRIAIIGPPNAGKSSLLNRLIGENRAIVSEIAGTTRDYIETEMELGGYNVRLFDTAGLRETSVDPIEIIGMARTRELISRAHICIELSDGSLAPTQADNPQATRENADQVWIDAINKADLLHPTRNVQPAAEMAALTTPLLISAKTGEGLAALLERLETLIRRLSPQQAMPLAVWQRELLASICETLRTARAAIEQNELPEVTTHCVGEAVAQIAQLTGEITSEDILGRIFSRFCIGK